MASAAPKDDVGARALFEKAAAQGHPGALVQMGAFAQSGRGGPQDSSAAKAYYEKAAALGNEDAKAALKRIGMSLRGQGQARKRREQPLLLAASEGYALTPRVAGNISAMNVVPNRECGECTVCCKVLLIDDPEFQKLPGVLCPNCKAGAGCQIYDDAPVAVPRFLLRLAGFARTR